MAHPLHNVKAFLQRMLVNVLSSDFFVIFQKPAYSLSALFLQIVKAFIRVRQNSGELIQLRIFCNGKCAVVLVHS